MCVRHRRSVVGKSRLIAELHVHATATQFEILQGQCFEQAASFPYAPWIDVLRASLASKRATEINEVLGSFASEVVKIVPELSLLILQIQPTSPLDPEAEKHRLFESLARFSASLAASNPLLKKYRVEYLPAESIPVAK